MKRASRSSHPSQERGFFTKKEGLAANGCDRCDDCDDEIRDRKLLWVAPSRKARLDTTVAVVTILQFPLEKEEQEWK
jgi:hypothetical protein